MKKYFLILVPFLLNATNVKELFDKATLPEIEILKACYEKDDTQCGIDYARLLKKEKKDVDAATVYLDLSLKGSIEATRELSKFYIYGANGIPQDCVKGVSILLNSISSDNPKESLPSYLEISNLFAKGICVDKSEKSSKKYKETYIKKSKALLAEKNKDFSVTQY